MNDVRTREKVAAAIPALVLVVTGAAMGLLWQFIGWYTMFMMLVPVASIICTHALYRQVLRPRQVRRFLQRHGVPADGLWQEALRFERETGRSFTSWKNPLLALLLHRNFSGHAWAVEAYQAWRGYDLGLDWEPFFSRAWRPLPTPNFDDRQKMKAVTPLLALIAVGKVDVEDVVRLARSDISFEAMLMVLREGLPLEYAAVL